MPSAWFTAFRPYALTIGCSPAKWTTGHPDRALLSHNGNESAAVRRLLTATQEYFPSISSPYALIALFDARSVLGEVATHDVEPPTDDDRIDWDIIEQGGVRFGGSPPDVRVVRGSVDTASELDQVLATVHPGWNMIRVHCMGLHADSYLAQIRIDIWPIEGPTEHEVIKYRAATFAPPEANAGRDRNVTELWPRLQSAMRTAGVIDSPVLDLREDHENPTYVTAIGHPSVEPDPPRAVEDLLGVSDWFAITESFPTGRLDGLIPGYDVLRLDEALAERKISLEAWDIGEVSSYPNVAGRSAFTFIPEYLPVAALDGYLLVADLRPGPLCGLIRSFEKVDGDDGTRTWKSIGDLLLDLIVTIETGAQFNGWDLSIVDGRMVWSLQ